MIDFKIEKILPVCESFGLQLDSVAVDRLNTYGNLLLEWNEKMNLTAICEPEEVLYKHFLDCLLFFKNIPVKTGASIIDVGTGAGFPGMVLKIARPDIQLTLLDGLNKRLVFLNDVLQKTGLEATTVHLRAEQAGQDKTHREKYDFAVARAVARLNVLSEYCIPLVKKGGVFVAMKAASASEEAAEAINAYKVLGCEKPNIICENLRENEPRAFIVAKKISQTSPKYPRMNGKIAKSAL